MEPKHDYLIFTYDQNLGFFESRIARHKTVEEIKAIKARLYEAHEDVNLIVRLADGMVNQGFLVMHDEDIAFIESSQLEEID